MLEPCCLGSGRCIGNLRLQSEICCGCCARVPRTYIATKKSLKLKLQCDSGTSKLGSHLGHLDSQSWTPKLDCDCSMLKVECNGWTLMLDCQCWSLKLDCAYWTLKFAHVMLEPCCLGSEWRTGNPRLQLEICCGCCARVPQAYIAAKQIKLKLQCDSGTYKLGSHLGH